MFNIKATENKCIQLRFLGNFSLKGYNLVHICAQYSGILDPEWEPFDCYMLSDKHTWFILSFQKNGNLKYQRPWKTLGKYSGEESMETPYMIPWETRT